MYRRVIVFCAILGFVIAVILYVGITLAQSLGLFELGGQIWLFILWPTSVLMMAAEGTGRFAPLFGFLIGTVTNAAAYALAGAVLARVYRGLSSSSGQGRSA